MAEYFAVIFLREAFEFLQSLKPKHHQKILFNIRKAQQEHNPELFKKLTEDIWEFRARYEGLQYRMLAFWNKTDTQTTLVISTHGFIKKQSRVPDKEIARAEELRKKYFQEKLKPGKI